MYIRIVIIIGRYSGYAYNIILLFTRINNNNTLCIYIDIDGSYRLRYIGLNGVCLRCRRNSEIHDADRAHTYIYSIYYITIYYTFVYCASMPTIYLYSHIYSIKDERPVSADASSSSPLGSVLYSAAAHIEEIHTCHPRRFNSRLVTRSGCYIIIIIRIV